ncbi:MAG: hypothetical protein EPO21_13050 [Chloroflexota bacterium]|nr:MAG: hypothetical protein EPO21_13050 [Chloroflexota bacterium]
MVKMVKTFPRKEGGVKQQKTLQLTSYHESEGGIEDETTAFSSTGAAGAADAASAANDAAERDEAAR